MDATTAAQYHATPPRLDNIHTLESLSDDRSQTESVEVVPLIGSVTEAVKYVQQTKLIPAIPQFITDGLTGADVVQFNQYLQAGVLSSFNIEVVQGLVQAEYDPDMGGVVLRITQLIAGFLIGPRGLSIRDLAQGTGCVIKSWTEDASLECPRDTRVFVLEGSEPCVLMCLDVVIAAIDRYKDLAEGRWSGQYVNKTQKIKGFVFVYYPPPKDRVPMAAGIRGFPPSSKQAVAARNLLGLNPEQTYQTALQNICAHMSGPMSPTPSSTPLQHPPSSPQEEIDDLRATYSGIFPGRIYNPKVENRGNEGSFQTVSAPNGIKFQQVGLGVGVAKEYASLYGQQQAQQVTLPLTCEVCSALAKGIKINDPRVFNGSCMCQGHKAMLQGMGGHHTIPVTGARSHGFVQNAKPTYAPASTSMLLKHPRAMMEYGGAPTTTLPLSQYPTTQPLQDLYKCLSEIFQNGQEDANTLKTTLDALSSANY